MKHKTQTSMDAQKVAELMAPRLSEHEIEPIRDERGRGKHHACWIVHAVIRGDVVGDQASRFICYAQGALVNQAIFTLDEVRDFNRKALL